MSQKKFDFTKLSERDQFIVGQMALDSIPAQVQKFYINSIDFLSNEFATIKDLAKREHYSERTVTNYMRLLRKKGYVIRYNYRAYVLGNEHTDDGYVLRSDNVFGKCAMRERCRI